MERAAACCLLLALIFWAFLSPPGASLSAMAGRQAGCPHHGGADPEIVSCPCCETAMPGQCGASGQGGMHACRCSGGNPAFIFSTAADTPTWRGSSYCPLLLTVSTQLFPAGIFHPPESHPFSAAD